MQINSERIKQARIERGWTQQQLAEIADLSLRTVQRVENQSNASNETLSALCAVLELKREQLLIFDPNRFEHQKALSQARILLPAAIMTGAAMGASLTLLLMWLING